MNFEFATASRIIFGAGKRKELPAILNETHADRVFVVIGSSLERARPILDLLDSAEIEWTTYSITGEPDLDAIRKGVSDLNLFAADAIIGVGGGSVLDAAKAFAGLEANSGDLLDYLEIIGAGKPLANPVRLPVIAIPTTAGTGSEVTRNAVISSPEHRLKVSLRSRTMLPAVALVDPELTISTPRAITAYTGMDALVQLIEPFVSNAATPMTDALCRQGLSVGAVALLRAAANGSDLAARSDMAFASLMGGLALANAKLGAVHGFAGVIGGMFDAPHGAICARLLAPVIAANLQALRDRNPSDAALRRYHEIAKIILGHDSSDELVVWANTLTHELDIPYLRHYGITSEDIAIIADKSARASSMKGNPIQLTDLELVQILESAL